MKRLFSLFLIFCLIVGCFAGCGGKEEEAYVPTGDALVMEGQDPDSVGPQEEDPVQEFSLAYYPDRTMNPLLSNDYTNRTVFSLIYQGLFSTNADYESIPILCKEYRVSPDGMIWTFYLEPATFSDGTPVTVNDVLATYEAARESKYYAGRFTHITSVGTSEDGRGVTFKLDTSYENLPILLDIPILKASELTAEYPLGTGPYALAFSSGGAYLHRRENWWTQQKIVVTATTIPLVASDSASSIRDEFEFSDVGVVCTDPGTASYADYRCDYELWDYDNGVMLYIGCNVNYSDVFSDERVRAALTYAINREQIVEDIYRGLAMPTTLVTSPRSPYYSSSLASQYAYDPMVFIDALSRYGVIMEPVKLLVNSDDSMRLRTARAIVDMLSESGLFIELDPQDTETFNRKLRYSEYDLYLGQTRLSPNMDLSPFFGRWGNMSLGGIYNEDLYALCKEALANHGNYYNLLKAVADDGRICPILFSGYFVYAKRGLLTDLSPSRDNVFCYTLGKTMEDCRLETVYD